VSLDPKSRKIGYLKTKGNGNISGPIPGIFHGKGGGFTINHRSHNLLKQLNGVKGYTQDKKLQKLKEDVLISYEYPLVQEES